MLEPDRFICRWSGAKTKRAASDPSIPSGMEVMPLAESPGQLMPLAATLGDRQNGVQDLKVGEAGIAALSRQAVRNLPVFAELWKSICWP